MPTDRPDPDQLLADVKAQAAAAARGRLRIYFGASAGVGKTFAMLTAAHALRESGTDVVGGVVETHGRRETEALLRGIDVLPRRMSLVNARPMAEFDIDAALARKPALLLVDELAHSNVPGSRHAKRWQDVEELLAAGIDVYSTLNVQHLESLNDVVGGITGVRVRETVPDTFFDAADEVIVVDLPADELIGRLAAGKVYLEGEIERAAQNFFRKGNLMALRELALRRTADRVEDDVQAYRVKRAIAPVWKTETSLLCGVGPRSDGEGIVRNAARLAAQLGADWTAVYVETPRLQRLPASVRERILRTLKLAEELGARTAVLPGVDAAQAIVDYARTHNCSKVVLGRPRRGGMGWGRLSLAGRVGALAADIDVVAVGRSGLAAARDERTSASTSRHAPDEQRRRRWRAYGLAVGAVALAAAVATLALPYLDPANIVMMFLLAIVLVAVRLGRGPAVAASFLSVAVFDFFFVAPRFSFAVSDVQYTVTFAVMLAVALVIGNLTAGLRFQAKVATLREERSRAVSEFARELSSLLEVERVTQVATGFIEAQFHGRAAILPLDAQDGLVTTALARVEGADAGTARWALDHAQSAGLGTDTLAGSRCLYLPLVAPMRTRGVLVLLPDAARTLLIPEQRRQLDTFAFLTALSLERVHYVEVAQHALLRMESERLRNSLLAALSHDLRTPLTSLVGVAESLGASGSLDATQQESVNALIEQSRRLASLVANLLDMARIETGDTRLRRTWQPIEEVIGSAIGAARPALGTRTVEVVVDRDAPLVEIDSVLIERVLYNLLENAGKYTPPGTPVRITAAPDGDEMRIAVSDRGPGVAKGQEAAIFEKFTRGVARESSTPGVGLGLSIARAIVEAHGGRIFVTAPDEGGASFVFTLPLGQPPTMSEGDAADDATTGDVPS
jgi:two-component system, OmpR family, sensor histidine kinase KdpD